MMKQRHGLATVVIMLLAMTTTATALTLNGFDIEKPLISANEIKRGGPPRDGIPALTDPRFDSATEIAQYNLNRPVLAISAGGKSKAYPVAILNFHELVNDELAGKPILVSYCPLCGTGMVFSRVINGKTLTFGVSGLLYNSNLLMYDRETESLWSQAQGRAISGPLKGAKLDWMAVKHLPLDDWLAKHPNSRVLSEQTGHYRSYRHNPYPGYEQSDEIWFDVNHHDNRYPRKEWVVGVKVGDKYKAYPYSELQKGSGTIVDQVNGVTLRIRFEDNGYALVEADREVGVIYSYWFSWIATFPESEIFHVE